MEKFLPEEEEIQGATFDRQKEVTMGGYTAEHQKISEVTAAPETIVNNEDLIHLEENQIDAGQHMEEGHTLLSNDDLKLSDRA